MVCVYFESTENIPNMDIKILVSKEFLEAGFMATIIAGWHNIQISLKTHVPQLQMNLFFSYSQGSKQ